MFGFGLIALSVGACLTITLIGKLYFISRNDTKFNMWISIIGVFLPLCFAFLNEGRLFIMLLSCFLIGVGTAFAPGNLLVTVVKSSK